MADIHWDPFGTPEEENLLTAPAAPLPEAEGGDEAPIQLRRDDMDAIAEGVLKRLGEEKPWDQSPFTPPDVMWATPTCPLSDWKHVDCKLEMGRGIVYVVFNRPNENNSIQDTLGHALRDAIQGLHARPDIRVAVFTGEGRMYCSGGDPKAWQAQAAAAKGGAYTGDGTVGTRIPELPQDPAVSAHIQELGIRAFKAGAFPDGNIDYSRVVTAKNVNTWARLPQFSISLVNGSAMGGGVGWVCVCDYVIALRRAYLVLSEVKIGVIPATISPYVIAKCGVSNGKRFFCAADNIPATKCMEYGMVNEVVENMKEGHERVREWVKLISKCGPRAVEVGKQLCFSCAGQPLTDGLLNYTAQVMGQCLEGEEGQKGLEAQVKGGEPPWEEIGFDVWPTVGETIPGGKKKKQEA